jgi:ubiquinone/menaquinone biosynthesis C-methylase UbiE
VARYFGPGQVTGVDFFPAAVDLARKINADTEILSFEVGDSEQLQFPDASFDIVLNIESSHCYGDVAAFAAEVERVLKPGGWFGWVDMRPKDSVDKTDAILHRPTFERRRAENISKDVVRALDAMNERKLTQTSQTRLLRGLIREFAGTKGSVLYRSLNNGSAVYMSRRFHKMC